MLQTMWLTRIVVLLLLLLISDADCWTFLHKYQPNPTTFNQLSIPPPVNATNTGSVGANESAMNRLLQVFGMEHHAGRRTRHSSPPQYMLDLYNSIADSRSGITIHHAIRYNAKTVRSFNDKDSIHHLHFHFNVSGIPKSERNGILNAELHLFKIKPRTKVAERYKDARFHLLEVRIYQVMSKDKTYTEDGNRLLDTRRISTYSVGWEVFYVRPAVIDWLKNEKSNYGLLINVRSMLKEKVDDGLLRFSKRHSHHSNKQPILVVFSDDGKTKSLRDPKLDFHYNEYSDFIYRENLMHSAKSHNTSDITNDDSGYKRSVRSVGNGLYEHNNQEQRPYGNDASSSYLKAKRGPTSSACTRHELYVDFDKIGWSTWIISPKGYNAYYCKGECTFPLGQNQLPTNHATVQSIVHELNLSPDVDKPCCVPNKLYSISLLYFDEQENVILKQYDDMIAASCGCH